jgi:hypothetical protein
MLVAVLSKQKNIAGVQIFVGASVCECCVVHDINIAEPPEKSSPFLTFFEKKFR